MPYIAYGMEPSGRSGAIGVHIPEDCAAWESESGPIPDAKHSGARDVAFDRDFLPPVCHHLKGRAGSSGLDTQSAGAGPKGPFIEPDLGHLQEALAGALRTVIHRMGLPWVTVAPWPSGKPFALFLSHDVDQVHDREFFYALANLNHLLKTAFGRTPGDARSCLRRIARTVFDPKPVRKDFETIREIEGRHGWRSTFFILQDRTWARHGRRYRLSDPEVLDLLGFLHAEGCEAGVHGGYYAFNNASAYAKQSQDLDRAWGARPEGIRNHYLRWSYPRTWQAQAEAGFTYDSTLGFSDRPGYRSRYGLPFHPFDEASGRPLAMVELPLVLMDNTLFQYLGCGAKEAMQIAQGALRSAKQHRGLLTLLWHNNYFNDPEYHDWQETYAQTLQEASDAGPWCATGGEIAQWWNARAGLAIDTIAHEPGGWTGRLTARDAIRAVQLRIEPPASWGELAIDGTEAAVRREGDAFLIDIPAVTPGAEILLRVVA